MNWKRFTLAAAATMLSLSLAAQTQPYYLTSGDNATIYVVQGGTLVNTISTFQTGYGAAIRDTIWLADRDYAESREYTLAGAPTGNTHTLVGNLSQMLDATAAGSSNYGSFCCGTSSVYRANADWTNPVVAFPNPDGTELWGIAYDPTTGHLFLSNGPAILETTTSGAPVSQFTVPNGGSAVSLAYETVTDTLWYFNRGTSQVVQLSKSGTELQRLTVAGLGGNIFGGEMPMSALAPAAVTVPALDPKALAALAALLGVAGFLALKIRG